MTFVLDASATIPWFLEDETGPLATARIDRLRAEGAVVPALWRLGVGNVLLTAFRRERLTQDRLDFALLVLTTAPITVDRQTFGDTLGSARSERLTLYDATYLELARRRGLPLETNDKALAKAALTLGVPLA